MNEGFQRIGVVFLGGKECMIGVEARGSSLLDEGGLEGVPDHDGVLFTVPNEHPDLMSHCSFEGPAALSALASHLSSLSSSGGTGGETVTP